MRTVHPAPVSSRTLLVRCSAPCHAPRRSVVIGARSMPDSHHCMVCARCQRSSFRVYTAWSVCGVRGHPSVCTLHGLCAVSEGMLPCVHCMVCVRCQRACFRVYTAWSVRGVRGHASVCTLHGLCAVSEVILPCVHCMLVSTEHTLNANVCIQPFNHSIIQPFNHPKGSRCPCP